MIVYIKEKLNWIEDELWKMAKDKYGLERNEETVERIHATTGRYINAIIKKKGHPIEPQNVAENIRDVDHGLAWMFFTVAMARDVEHPDTATAIDYLVLAAKGLGVLEVASRLPNSEHANIDFVSLFAAEMARKRHAENYSMIDEALNYWRANIDPSLSASKAANELVRVVPLSHKKLAAVISTAKKELS